MQTANSKNDKKKKTPIDNMYKMYRSRSVLPHKWNGEQTLNGLGTNDFVWETNAEQYKRKCSQRTFLTKNRTPWSKIGTSAFALITNPTFLTLSLLFIHISILWERGVLLVKITV